MTLVLLREMRQESQTEFAKLNDRMGRLEKRLEAMHQNGLKAMGGFVGHRAMVQRAMGSFEEQVNRLERRVGTLEAERPVGA